MNISSRVLAGVRAGWTWLGAPGPPPPGAGGHGTRSARPGASAVPGRGAGDELVLALVLALLAAGTEKLAGADGARVLGACVGAAVLSPLRRRLPLPVLVVTAALAAEVVGLFGLQLVAGWSAGRRIAGIRRVLAAFTGAYLAFLGATALAGPGPLVAMFPILTLAFLATAVIPGLAGRHWNQRQTLLRAVQDRNAQLLFERELVAGQARLLERQRIAQDMHDSLGHQLALIAVHTGALEVDPELTGRQREAVGVLRSASVTAMHELREVVGILRDGIEDGGGSGAEGRRGVRAGGAGSTGADAGAGPRAGGPVPGAPDGPGRARRGTAGVQGLVEAARAAGTSVELRREGEPRPLAAAADHAAYRIVQEALTNAYKHAPGAPIAVALRYEPDALVAEIVSGAASGAPAAVSGGQGLTGLRERARLVGGMVHTGPVPGGGFRVAGVLPYGTAETAPAVGTVPAVGTAPPLPGPPVRPDGPGSGVPVMDWSPPGPAAGAPGPERRRAFSALGTGCGLALVAALVLGSVVVASVFHMDSLEEHMIERSEYERAEIGESEDEVRARLPAGDPDAGERWAGQGPGVPGGAECLTLGSWEMTDTAETEPVFRFCFRDGELIEKKAYHVRS
ncbi:sensor histidine kinase [Streptomyces sp. NPDC001889]